MDTARTRRLRPQALLAAIAMLCVALSWMLPASATQAAVLLPLESVYSDTVFGSVVSVGNGSMRCPTAADGVNLRAGTSFEACALAQAGSVPAGPVTNNNDYSMRWNDTDGRADTFNHSSATVSIPAGASIRYAMLEWAGHTGEFRTSGGATSSIRSCNVVGQQYSAQFPTALPGAPAAAAPESQSPGLQINGGEPVWVSPNVTRDSGAAWPNNSDRMYTGWADVTELLENAELTESTEVTVSNVWAPTGVNCTAGWGLTVVWAFEESTPGVAEFQNSINIYQGHVRQGAADLPSAVTFAGFEAVSTHNRVGLVAYEGDRGTVGDRFSINGTDVAEPTGYGTTNDFFVSAAAGSSNPSAPVNFSVDVNDFSTNLIHAGDTEATLGFRTNGDGYWLQSVWLEAPVASLHISKTANIAVGRPGDPVVWTITVSNPSPAELHDVTVADPLEPSCDREIPPSALVSNSFTYTCEGVLPDATVTNVATATALTEAGGELRDEARASVEVIHPELSIAKSADRVVYADGEQINFAIVVANPGDVDMTDVVVHDEKVPDCSIAIGTLAPGAEQTVHCSATAPIAGDENTATVAGTDPLGNRVERESTAPSVTARPSLSVTKSVSEPEIVVGDTVTFSVTVVNDGNVRLNDVVIEDALVTGCSALIGTLMPGESRTQSCTWDALHAGEFVNTARATAKAMRCTGAEAAGACVEELGGAPIEAEGRATTQVIAPVGPPSSPDQGGRGGGAVPLSSTGGANPALPIALGLLAIGCGVALAVRARHRSGELRSVLRFSAGAVPEAEAGRGAGVPRRSYRARSERR